MSRTMILMILCGVVLFIPLIAVLAIFCAIRQARTVVETGVVDLIREGVGKLDAAASAEE